MKLKKIIITGGGGFIGTELVKLFKKKNNVIIIDKKKNQKKISTFKKLKVKFVKGDLTNKSICKKFYKNAKIIYHLAGITKVPSTDVNIDKKKEQKIYSDTMILMKNLLELCNKNTNIIFPSTHLVFENCKKNKKIFNEKSRPMPNLAYSKSKLKCESLLSRSPNKHIILRLGSVYGETLKERMFNMPNLFPLRTKNGKNLKLFSKGVQIKGLVSVKDVAKAMFFFSKKIKKNQIFNLVSEHFTVKEIANICRDNNKNIKLISTKDKIPTKGYFMSKRKILKSGFKFSHSYKTFVKSYINN